MLGADFSAALLGAYLSMALRLCAVAAELPLIAERLGVRLSDVERSVPKLSNYTDDIDWQVIATARNAQVEFAEAIGNRTRYTTGGLSREHQALVKRAVKKASVLADKLYERALELARREGGRQSLGRILAAFCVHKGQLPR